jgi:hypothetical protein
MIKETERLAEKHASAADLEYAMKKRAVVNRRIAELIVATASNGNVVQFPTTLH